MRLLPPSLQPSASRGMVLLALAVAYFAAGTGLVAFGDLGTGRSLTFLCLPPLAWAAFRFFRVRLPSVPQPPEVPAPDAPAAGVGRGRLLLIEDNADARESLSLALELSGYTVTSAEDGPRGVDSALRSRPDVALVDIGLPGFDGYEVARRIRAGLAGADMLLVALTGYGQARDRDRAAEAGFDLHVVKPVEPDRLVALLSAAPRGRDGGA